MPLRRPPGPPDLDRVVAVLAGPPPARVRRGWVPEGRGGPSSGLGALTGLDLEAALPERPSATVREGQRAKTDDETAQLDADLRAARRPRVLTVPEQLRTGRLAVSSAAVLSLLALVVAVACAFALRVLWADRSAGTVLEPAPRVSATVSVHRASARVAATTGATSGAATGTAGAQVVVHVVGQVKRPGLVRLKPGARVADAIAAAGGAGPRADLSLLNLARLVVDGEQVQVPKPGQAVPTGGGAVSGGAGPGSTGGGATGGGGLVNLNTADLAALDTLPGVGPVLAQRILDWRSEHGRFTSVEELGEVSGIGEKLYAQIRPKVTV